MQRLNQVSQRERSRNASIKLAFCSCSAVGLLYLGRINKSRLVRKAAASNAKWDVVVAAVSVSQMRRARERSEEVRNKKEKYGNEPKNKKEQQQAGRDK